MVFPGRKIASKLTALLKDEVKTLQRQGMQPHLTAILAGESPAQVSFINIKRKMAEELGIEFEFVYLQKIPSYEEFAHILKGYAHQTKVNGILIQQPLPFQLQTDSIYNFIPLPKEIEGHRPKSPFYPPIGLAVLTAMKYIFSENKEIEDFIFDIKKDQPLLKKALKHKRMVLVGRGITGGQPIGRCLSALRINYLSIGSKTTEPEDYFKDADIIITAVGKKVIQPNMLKTGVILLNLGLRKDETGLQGDYDIDEIKDIASWYSPTPGGIGPIDVLYLFRNLLEATKLQM